MEQNAELGILLLCYSNPKIGNIVGQLRAGGEQIDDPDLSRVSPLAHRHVIAPASLINQAFEILFAVCHGPGRRSAEPFTSLGWLFLERFSTKDRAKLQDNHNLFNESLRENADL
jgi:hypothetical protein